MKMTFGKYNGKTVEWIAEHDPSYLIFLASLPLYRVQKDRQACVLLAKEMAPSMSNEAIRSSTYRYQKLRETKWLKKFLRSEVNNPSSRGFEKRIAYSVVKSLVEENRLNKISFKQLKVVCDLWGRSYGAKGTPEYFTAIQVFREKMRPYWTRKHQSVDDL